MGVNFLTVFERLLPRSGFWSMVYDRTLRKFFDGLAYLPSAIKDHAESIMIGAFPEHTTKFYDWSLQHGSVDTLDADGIAGEWGAFGAQTPEYMRSVLATAGFENLYVHEWWVPESDPVEYRNPIPVIPNGRVLVNGVVWVDKNWKYQSGGYFADGTAHQSRSDASIRTGDFDGWGLRYKVYPCPDIPDEYPHYWYITGPIWPEYAIIAKSDLRRLMRLIFKIKPMFQRVVLMVQVYDDTGGETVDFDIQDTWWDPEEYYDVIVGEEGIQDH